MRLETAQSNRYPRLRSHCRWLWLVLGPALAFGACLSVSAARAQEIGADWGMAQKSARASRAP
jgi:hypothetical protein